jgi:hypothetical protein
MVAAVLVMKVGVILLGVVMFGLMAIMIVVPAHQVIIQLG